MNTNPANPVESEDVVIRLSGISKKYNLYKNKTDRLKEALHPIRRKYHREFYALKDINLDIKRGEVLGIVGKNGSGKSTLLKVISSILTPTLGTVEVIGKVVPLLELGSGFNPEYTGMENIYFYSAIMGYTREQIDRVVDDIINFAEIGEFIHQPIKTYSSGMRARLAFAVSVNVNPDILILDEVLSVGDELFSRKCYARMHEFFDAGKTILYVSHNAYSIVELCTRTILLDSGRIILEGNSKRVIQYYQKLLYTKGINQNSVRKEIDELYGNIEKKQIEKKDTISKNISKTIDSTEDTKAYYIADLISKNTFITKNYDIEIYDYAIKTKLGKKVNYLITGDSYILSYKIKSKEKNIDGAIIGARFKNERALVLMGIRYNATSLYNYTGINICVNEIYGISFRFECNLLNGIYYIDLGIERFINDNKEVVVFIEDALVFKVSSSQDSHQWGFLNINPHVEIEKEN